MKEDEAVKMRNEISKFNKIRDNYDKKLSKCELDRYNIIEDRDKLRQMYCNMEKEVEQYKKQSDLDKRTMDGMNREKDILNKNILRHQGKSNPVIFTLTKSNAQFTFSCRQRSHQINQNSGTNTEEIGVGNRRIRN